jgi:hypothetical protein
MIVRVPCGHAYFTLSITRILHISSHPLHRLLGLKAHAVKEDIFSAGSMISYDWVEPNIQRLLRNECARHIILNTYTFPEVRIYLAHALKTMTTFLPKKLDYLVFQLSGD